MTQARNPELDHEFQEDVPEEKPGTAGFVYVEETSNHTMGQTFNPLESAQMTSLVTMGSTQKKTWRRIVLCALILAAVLALGCVVLSLIGIEFQLFR